MALWKKTEEFWEKYASKRAKRIRRLSGEQNHRCAYCSRVTWFPEDDGPKPKNLRATLEHVLEKCKGGTYGWLNTVMACHKCNNKRSNHMSAQQFFEFKLDPTKWVAWNRKKAHQKAKRDEGRAEKSEARRLLWIAAGCPRKPQTGQFSEATT